MQWTPSCITPLRNSFKWWSLIAAYHKFLYLDPLLFIAHINDLVHYPINDCGLHQYADDAATIYPSWALVHFLSTGLGHVQDRGHIMCLHPFETYYYPCVLSCIEYWVTIPLNPVGVNLWCSTWQIPSCCVQIGTLYLRIDWRGCDCYLRQVHGLSTLHTNFLLKTSCNWAFSIQVVCYTGLLTFQSNPCYSPPILSKLVIETTLPAFEGNPHRNRLHSYQYLSQPTNLS